MKTGSSKPIAEWFLRIALSISFISAFADRLWLWAPAGAPNVSWSDWDHFLAYSAKLNGWIPTPDQPALGRVATIIECVLGVAPFVPVPSFWGAIIAGLQMTIFPRALPPHLCQGAFELFRVDGRGRGIPPCSIVGDWALAKREISHEAQT